MIISLVKRKLNIFKLNTPFWLWFIFIFALLIRLAGIWYGLPLFLNIDEPSTVSTTVGLKSSLNPHRFDWPSLFFYMNAVAYTFLYAVRSIVGIFKHIPFLESDAALFLTSRLLTAISGALTVFPIYFVTKKLFKSQMAAYLSAVMLSVLPVHVDESHLAKLDVPQTLVVAVAMYFIVRVFYYGKRADYIYTGIFIGIATSIKYNAFLIFLPLLLATLSRAETYAEIIKIKFLKPASKNLSLAGIISIITFYIGSPYALLDYKNFWSYERGVGILWQFENVGKISWQEYPISIYETFVSMYSRNMGEGLWLIFTLLCVLFLYFNKRKKEYILTLVPTLAISLYMSNFERSPDHYFIFLIPFYIPALAGFLTEIFVRINAYKSFNKYLYATLFAIIIIPSIYRSFKASFLYSMVDTRNSAFDWIAKNVDVDNDLLLIYGDELSEITFKEKMVEPIKKVDQGSIEFDPPYYIMIGQEDLTYEDIMMGNRDPKELSGNSARILRDAQLVFYVDNKNRHGPPIYIFKVMQLSN